MHSIALRMQTTDSLALNSCLPLSHQTVYYTSSLVYTQLHTLVQKIYTKAVWQIDIVTTYKKKVCQTIF